VAATAGRVPQGVVGVAALLVQHLHEAGDTAALDLL
jgi:hypothetical protein